MSVEMVMSGKTFFSGKESGNLQNFGETAFSRLNAFPQTPSENEITRVTNFTKLNTRNWLNIRFFSQKILLKEKGFFRDIQFFRIFSKKSDRHGSKIIKTLLP